MVTAQASRQRLNAVYKGDLSDMAAL
jgi:hypothetical protein